MKIVLNEQNGRQTSFIPNKSIVSVGYAPSCDLKLAPNIGSPIHLQVIYSVDQNLDRCKIIIFGPETTLIRQSKRTALSPSSQIEVFDKDEIQIGPYILFFELANTSGIIKGSSVISASLVFRQTTLSPEKSTIGLLKLQNLGQISCQFQLEISGLPGDCIRHNPIPMLPPQGQGQVEIRLSHHGRHPSAGMHELKFAVASSQAYPGEEVVLIQPIYVSANFEAQIDLKDDTPIDVITNNNPQAILPVKSGNNNSATPEPAIINELPLPPTHQTTAPTAETPIRKISQQAPAGYWDDEINN